jgi:hypothetical protein
MQVTLVSHYGEKPPACTRRIREIQQSLTEALGTRFRPYGVEQVHATIVGLEGARVGDRIRNENFRRLRGEDRFVDFTELIEFLRSPAAPDFSVQIGGFKPELDYGFSSQGRHPFVRSFSIQGETAVAMGWPRAAGQFACGLDQFRREVQRLGILHKWHRSPDDVDNDFFFVLGRISGSAPEEQRASVEQQVRELLARHQPLLLPVSRDTLCFVAYEDRELPLDSSRCMALMDCAVTPEALVQVYRPK